MHATCYGEHDALRPCPTSLDHACTRWSNSGLQVEDLKVSVTPFVVQRAVDVSVSCTVAELYGHDDDLFGIGLMGFEGSDAQSKHESCVRAAWEQWDYGP